MTQNDDQRAAVRALGALLERDDGVPWLWTENERGEDVPRRWLSRALSAFALLFEGEEVLFAQAVREGEAPGARIVALSVSLVVVAEVVDVDDSAGKPRVSVVPRSDLVSLVLSASASAFPEERRPEYYTWPGEIEVQANYAHLADAVVVRGLGTDRWERGEPAAITKLLAALRNDLAGTTPAVDNS